jgi:hypothetical protein
MKGNVVPVSTPTSVPVPTTEPAPEPIIPSDNAPSVELSKTSASYVMENNHPLFDFRKTKGKPLAIVRVLSGETIQYFISMLTMGKAAYLSCVTTKGEAIILGIEPIAA